MGIKVPKERLKKLKKKHRKSRDKGDKYKEWKGARLPMLDMYLGQYELGRYLKKIIM